MQVSFKVRMPPNFQTSFFYIYCKVRYQRVIPERSAKFWENIVNDPILPTGEEKSKFFGDGLYSLTDFKIVPAKPCPVTGHQKYQSLKGAVGATLCRNEAEV